MTRIHKVVFASESIRKKYEKLRLGNGSDRFLYKNLSNAIKDIEDNPYCGIRIRENQLPKIYRKKMVGNILKYDLPKGWRLIYTISQDDIEIVAIIIEWFDHKNYENRFNYLI